MRILLIRYSSLGDVVLASAVPGAIRAAYPDAHIAFLTKDTYRTIIEHSAVDVTLVGVSDRHALRNTLTSLRGQQFDYLIDLHGLTRSRLASRLISSKQRSRINKHDARRKLMIIKKEGLNEPLSVVDNYLNAARSILPDVKHCEPSLALSAEEHAQAARLQSEYPSAVGIGWGARWATKAVPASLWTDAITALHAQGTTAIRMFGLEKDTAEMTSFMDEMVRRIPGIRVVVHTSLSLMDVLLHLKACKAFVGSDSGLAHIAAALGVPTVSVFGPTHPSLGFAPVGHHTESLHAGSWCSPCHKHGSAPCFRDRRYCFDELTGTEIADSVTSVSDGLKSR